MLAEAQADCFSPSCSMENTRANCPPVQSPRKHPSKIQAGLSFWAEKDEGGAWIVVSHVEGFPATEAFDDWLGSQEAADDVAKLLAGGGVGV